MQGPSMLSPYNANGQTQVLEQSACLEAMVVMLPALPDNSASPALWSCKCKCKHKYVSHGLFFSNWQIYERK